MHTAPPTNPRRGSALFAAMAVVLTVGVLSICLLQLNGSMTREQVVSVDNKRALYLAEAGLAEAMYGLTQGMTGNVGTKQMPATFGNGIVWVEADDMGNGRIALESTAAVGGGRFSLSSVVEKLSTSVATLGFFGRDGVDVGRGVLIDEYDSRGGPYAVQKVIGGNSSAAQSFGVHLAGSARVGANGDIDVDGIDAFPSTIDGDAKPGPTGTVYVAPAAKVTGSTLPRDENVDLPPIPVPTTLTARGDVLHTGPQPLVLLDGSYGTITVMAGAEIQLIGPSTVVVEELRVEPTAGLLVDSTSGPIKLYATEFFQLSPASLYKAVTTDPTGTTFMVSADEEDFDGDGTLDPAAEVQAQGDFFGTLYAPETMLALGSTLQVFGAVVARELDVQDNCQLHFDAALLSSKSSSIAMPRMLTWRVVELPKSKLSSTRLDPIKALGLENVDLPRAPDAHDEQLWKIKFVNTSGQTEIWSGKQEEFEGWGQVQSVIWSGEEGTAGFESI